MVDAVLRRTFGVEPGELTMSEYFGLLDRIVDIAEMESAQIDWISRLGRMESRRLDGA